MFDLGWTELLLIGIVALIVVGPKDLPMLFRKVGKFVGKARGMAREFSRAMDDAADEAGVKEVSKTFKAASNPFQASLDEVKKATTDLTKYNPESETGKLAADRAEAAEKIRNASAKKTTERKATGKAAATKPAAKKAANVKTVAKDAGEKSIKKPRKVDTKASEASKD